MTDSEEPLRFILSKAASEVNDKLNEMLKDDMFAAALRGHWEVKLFHWNNGAKAAVVENDEGEIVLVGPRRRIMMRSTETHLHFSIVTEPFPLDNSSPME